MGGAADIHFQDGTKIKKVDKAGYFVKLFSLQVLGRCVGSEQGWIWQMGAMLFLVSLIYISFSVVAEFGQNKSLARPIENNSITHGAVTFGRS